MSGWTGPWAVDAACLLGAALPHRSPARALSARPPAGDMRGTLELLIAATGEKNTYTLMGHAAEPVAEGQLLVECQVRLGGGWGRG